MAERRRRTDDILLGDASRSKYFEAIGPCRDDAVAYRTGYEELKSEIGLNHFAGRGWRGFRHHATRCIATNTILVAERSLFPPEAEPRWNPFRTPVLPAT